MKRIQCAGIKSDGVLMFGYNTRLVFHPSSTVILGTKIISDGRLVIITDKNSHLEIGDSVYFNENMMISCKKKIRIGSKCKFGPNVSIFDNDHVYDSKKGVSDKHSTASVVIGENTWVGANTVILKGSHIGKNCVIGAGTVIKDTIPDGMIVIGNKQQKIFPITKES